jgi:hypothetical protein
LRINGVRLDPLAPDQLHERVSSFVGCGLSHVVHFLPAHPTVIARKDLAYRDVLNRGDLNRSTARRWHWPRSFSDTKRRGQPAPMHSRCFPQSIPLRRLAEATGLSLRYCALIRQGKRIPHRRHWQTLLAAIGPRADKSTDSKQ